jgi:signal peptidase I
MDWLAGLSIEWILLVAFAIAFIRLGLHLFRNVLGPKLDAYGGELLESILCAWVIVFLFIRPFFFEQFSIPSGSMIPTLLIGDRIVVNKYDYRFHPPQRGDIIVFKSPPSAKQNQADFVKRLIGLPGDTVDLIAGDVYINGKKLNEPYIREPDSTEPLSEYPSALTFPFHVPPNYYLMMGDNRSESFDSRGWGLIEPWRIKGKAVWKFWPPNAFGVLH